MSSLSSSVDSKLYFTEDHDDWLCALMADDIDTVRYIISNCGDKKKHILLEGSISDGEFWKCWNNHEFDKHQITTVQRPWCLAAVCGSQRVVKELYQAGIDVFQKDKLGNNIIHTLIIQASRQQESLHLEMYNFIVALISHENLTSLLLAENADGLRPVELAAYFHTLRLLDAILETPGIYLSKKVRCATLFINHYDVSDYESCDESRTKTKSLLYLLIFLRSHKLCDPYTKEIYTSGLIGQWISCRKKVFMPLIIMWLFMRLFVVGLALFPTILSMQSYTLLCGIHMELPKPVRLVTLCMLAMIAASALVFDFLDMYQFCRPKSYWMTRYVPTKGNLVVRYYFYRTVQLLNNLAIFIACIDRILSHYRAPMLPTLLGLCLVIVVLWGSVWSILFFVQLSHIFGNYVIATQRMLFNLMRFSLIILIFFVPSAILFPRFISVNEDGTCPLEFRSMTSSFYTTFTVILNMIDLTTFRTPSAEGLMLFHVGFVIMVAILLLNFLIAIFSDSYDEVSSNKEVTHAIQWLSVMTTIEHRIPTFLRPLLDKWKRRYFLYSEGRIYVKTFEIAKRRWNQWHLKKFSRYQGSLLLRN